MALRFRIAQQDESTWLVMEDKGHDLRVVAECSSEFDATDVRAGLILTNAMENHSDEIVQQIFDLLGLKDEDFE